MTKFQSHWICKGAAYFNTAFHCKTLTVMAKSSIISIDLVQSRFAFQSQIISISFMMYLHCARIWMKKERKNRKFFHTKQSILFNARKGKYLEYIFLLDGKQFPGKEYKRGRTFLSAGEIFTFRDQTVVCRAKRGQTV